MKDFILIGLAVIGSITLAVDYFFLEGLMTGGIVSNRQELWGISFLFYLVLLVPPCIMQSPERVETVSDVAIATGMAALDIARYLSLGAVLCIGWYIASNVLGML